MRNWKSHRCAICGKVYKEIGAFENHMRKEHPGEIPDGWSIRRYVYFIHTGQTAGICRICNKPTGWNEATGKYARICGSDECKKKYRDKFMADMRARRGTTKPMDDPKVREKMLVNRRISGVYEFQDGGKVPYMGKLEEGFLKMLDTFFRFPSSDIMGPSPNRYVYYYENPEDPEHTGEHVYIPDFYIPSINMEIELKSATNTRPDHLKIHVVKDAYKDVRMLRDPTVNYVKIYEDDFHVFFQAFADFAAADDPRQVGPIKYVSRSLLSSVYMQCMPADCLEIIKKYIYKYSEGSVLKAKKIGSATEAFAPGENPDEEFPVVVIEDPTVMNAQYEEPENFADQMYANDFKEAQVEADEKAEEEPEELTSIGLDPYIFYALAQETEFTSVSESFHMFEFPEENPNAAAAMEGIFFKNINIGGVDKNTTAGRSALQSARWRDKFFTKGLIGKVASKMTVKVEVRNQRIYISGINCNLLVYRMKECFEESRLKHIFEYVYNPKSLKEFNKKKISRGAMKIDSIHTPEFFAMELVTIFNDLSDRYRDKSYEGIAQTIYENTWLSKADSITMPDMDLSPLKNLTLELLDHQKEFIKSWAKVKARLNMNGYILAFQPGKGKTLTAVGLGECLRASHVWIICPNNLKDNWALEIRKYYAKYQDDALWHKECVILDGKSDIEDARFIITNNEGLKHMKAVAFKDPDSLVIIDECHNFRNYFGTRSAELFATVDDIGSKNVLCMSATPIKAAPSEITPALRCIDPTFTDEVAQMYAKCFAIDDVAAMRIIEKRFGLIMWRPSDVKVDLPPKYTQDLDLRIKGDESRFYMTEVHDEIVASFHIKHEKWLQENQKLLSEFDATIKQYSTAGRELTNQYLDWTKYMMNSTRVSEDSFHELEVMEFKVFIEKYIKTNPKCAPAIATKLAAQERTITTAAKVAMGKAIGEILPPRRNEMYIALFNDNIDNFVDRIKNRSKKTVIFSTMVPVVNAIYRGLNDAGVKTVMITGAVQNRLPILQAFKEDQTIEVLVATSQTLGVGLTLTEASQMFFFGTPWRSADYEQACDRIWRIGQTDEVNIYNVMMASSRKNLSQRMKDILEWSDRMFSAAITDTAALVGEEVAPATEAYFRGEPEELNILLNYYGRYAKARHAYPIDGHLIDIGEIPPLPERYHALKPIDFREIDGGTTIDFAINFFYWNLESNVSHSSNALFLWLDHGEDYHIINYLYCTDRYYWVECCDKSCKGVYEAQSVIDIVSYYLERHEHGPNFHIMEIRSGDWEAILHRNEQEVFNYIATKCHNWGKGFEPKTGIALRNMAALQAAVEMEAPIQFGGMFNYTKIESQSEMNTLAEIQRIHTRRDAFRFTCWVQPKNYKDVPIYISRPDDRSMTDWAQTILLANELYEIKPTYMTLFVVEDDIDNTFWYKICPIVPYCNGFIIPDVAPCPGGGFIYWADTVTDVGTYFYRHYKSYTAPPAPYYLEWNRRFLDGNPLKVQIYMVKPDQAVDMAKDAPFIDQYVDHIRATVEPAIEPMPRRANFWNLQILRRGVVTSENRGGY